jgi:hypothetical protein
MRSFVQRFRWTVLKHGSNYHLIIIIIGYSSQEPRILTVHALLGRSHSLFHKGALNSKENTQSQQAQIRTQPARQMLASHGIRTFLLGTHLLNPSSNGVIPPHCLGQ